MGGKNLVHVRPSKTCRLTFYSSSIYSFPDNKLKQIRNKFETKIRTKPDKLRQNQDVLQCLINTRYRFLIKIVFKNLDKKVYTVHSQQNMFYRVLSLLHSRQYKTNWTNWTKHDKIKNLICIR